MSSPRLIRPLPFLSIENELGSGAVGYVYGIDDRVAFKCATYIRSNDEAHIKRGQQSKERLNQEKRIVAKIMRSPHQNLVRGILVIPEGIFMERAYGNIQTRVESASIQPIKASMRRKWEIQLLDAICWLEQEGLVHGDVRPSNVFLDKNENVKLGDFDASCEAGQILVAASVPYCFVDCNFDPLPAGPETEQFAYAGTVYFIEFEHAPFHELSDVEAVRHIQARKMPSTKEIGPLGLILQECWSMSFSSLSQVRDEVAACLHKTAEDSVHEVSYADLLERVQAFLSKNPSYDGPNDG